MAVERDKAIVFTPIDLLWATFGLLVTIGGTWLEAFITNGPWDWSNLGPQPLSLGVSFQVGAVLLTGCLGGRNAASLAQIAYLALGLVWFEVFGFQVFGQGGGLTYLQEPSFGYLLGFIPAAWVCGSLAFRSKPKLETLAFSCLAGLLVIHIAGIAYLLLAFLLGWLGAFDLSLGQAIFALSISQIPGQLVVACAVAVLSYVMRHLMFY